MERTEGATVRTAVSVIIVNYNYAMFLAAAIESALSQDYPELEVVVVDDGSTDDSRNVIARYGGRVRVLLKDNGGMCSAVNAGFALTTGAIVMIVDADDYLHPRAVSRVTSAWQPGCSKVQFRLSLVDAVGVRVGADPPVHVPMPSGDVLPRLATTGRYPCAITVGNAYNRKVIAALFPLPETGPLRNSADGYLNPLCPFFGPITSLADELGSYRLHGANLWAMSGDVTVKRVRDGVEHDLEQQRQMQAQAAARRHPWPNGVMLRDPDHLLFRLSSLRLDRPRHPVCTDTRLFLLRAAIPAVIRHPDLSLAERLYQLILLTLVATLPPAQVNQIVSWTLAARPKPVWLRTVARILRRSGQSSGTDAP